MWLKPISNLYCFLQLELPGMDIFYFIFLLKKLVDKTFLGILELPVNFLIFNRYFTLHNPVINH